jgi:hypothetical protein
MSATKRVLLDPEESLAKLKEENEAIYEKRKIAGQKELEDQERSAGPRIPFAELLSRLKKLNSQLIVRDGLPGHVALYAPRSLKELETAERDFERDIFFHLHKYVSGFPKEDMPEYAHIIVDERGLPKREYRGWRSVLMPLIKQGVISYEAAVEEFGEAMGQRSHRWHSELRNYRKH